MKQTTFKKAPGASTNTYHAVVKGAVVRHGHPSFIPTVVNAMFTSDTHGETLSLQDFNTGNQVMLPFEVVQELIEFVRMQRAQMEVHNE